MITWAEHSADAIASIGTVRLHGAEQVKDQAIQTIVGSHERLSQMDAAVVAVLLDAPQLGPVRDCPACVHRLDEHDGLGCVACWLLAEGRGLPCVLPRSALLRLLSGDAHLTVSGDSR